jgi:hypothetical protein
MDRNLVVQFGRSIFCSTPIILCKTHINLTVRRQGFLENGGFLLTEALVHLGFHFRRPLSGIASDGFGLSVS